MVYASLQAAAEAEGPEGISVAGEGGKEAEEF